MWSLAQSIHPAQAYVDSRGEKEKRWGLILFNLPSVLQQPVPHD